MRQHRRITLGVLLLICLADSPARETVPVLPSAGTIEAYFTPWDDAQAALVSAIEQARQQVLVQAYVLTSRAIAASLIRAHRRGIDVRVMADQRQYLDVDRSQLDDLARAGIPVCLETRYRSAHNKVMLIDVRSSHAVVITGSYNYSWGAQHMNAENLLVIRGHAALAGRYESNWMRHQSDAALLESR